MSLTVTIEEVKERFEELVRDATERHEEIVVEKEGSTVARVVPEVVPQLRDRVPGCDRGKFVVPPEFFDPLPADLS